MAEIKRAQSHDEILRRLMTEHEIPLRRMCCMYLRDEQLAADAVQETFLRAYLALDSFRGDSSEKTWLTRIAVNVCHSMRRTGWMRYIDRRVTLDKLPETAVHADYALTELTLDIMRLPQKLIDVVLLHDYQGFTTRETGEMLGVPYQTVITRLKKAHTILQIDLKGGAPE
ncbi:MAG: sigma-70 family RNA polymerase sigma factor [Clostridia bacterium]|nr:sigma-70 family RNA polymerase sigma factor [Clostridia bacterium]